MALDSLLLRTVVVCGGLSVLLTAAPAAASVAGRDMAVASAGSGAAFMAPLPEDVAGHGSPERSIVEAGASTPSESRRTLTGTPGWTPRDSAEDDDDDDNDDGGLEHRLPDRPARILEARRLVHLESIPSASLESDGHSLRAPPQ